MLTDELTHCFTPQLINPSYAYSFMLIPCLPIDYKAPIVLLQIPYKACFFPTFLFEILCFPHVYNAPWSSQEPRWNPPFNSTKLSLSLDISLSLSLPVFLYSLSLVGFSEGLKASVFKCIQVYQVQVISLGSSRV